MSLSPQKTNLSIDPHNSLNIYLRSRSESVGGNVFPSMSLFQPCQATTIMTSERCVPRYPSNAALAECYQKMYRWRRYKQQSVRQIVLQTKLHRLQKPQALPSVKTKKTKRHTRQNRLVQVSMGSLQHIAEHCILGPCINVLDRS